MLRETLDEGTDDHDDGAAKDGPATTELVVDDGDEGQRQNGAERVGGGDDALEGANGVVEVWVRRVSEDFLLLSRPSSLLTGLPERHNLEGVDHLGVKPRCQLDTHACREQHHVEEEQVRLLEEPFLVLVGDTGDDGIGLADLGGRASSHG